MTQPAAPTGDPVRARTGPRSRIAALDIARGIAILGTFGTNVWIFSDPRGLAGYLVTVGAEPLPIRVLQTLAQGKFLGLLSLMFGVGLAIQQASAARRGTPWPGRYWRRALILFVDGAVHYLLIAEFDVLMGYAAVSFVVSALLVLRPRARTRWLVGAAAVHLLLVAVIIAGLSLAGEGAVGGRSGPNPYADGSFRDLVVFRLHNLAAFRAEAVFLIPMTIALFLLGSRLFQAGLFGRDGARLRGRLMMLGGVAAPLDLLVGVAGAPLGLPGQAVFLGRYVLAPVVAVGLLALIAAVYLAREPGVVGLALGRIGTTALSCYVLQNLIASVLCYGWGLGLAQRYGGEHRLAFTIALYVLVVVCLVVASRLWTARFARGPIEMVMHRLA